jgi:hypothetical protein
MDARMSDRFWRGFVVGGIAFLAIGMLWLGTGQPRTALAQVPDSGAQRLQMIHEQQLTNQKLDIVVKLLTDIRDQGADKTGEKKDASKDAGKDAGKGKKP